MKKQHNILPLLFRLLALATILFLGAQIHAAPLDRAAIERELRDVSQSGIDHRLGPDYAFYHPKADEKFPEIYMPESKQEKGGRRYQIGGPWSKKSGDFSSTQGQVLYAPDAAGAPGVDRVTILEWSNYCFSERPEAPWWGGFRPEPAYKTWNAATTNNPGQPLAMARGTAGWANCGVIIFSSGLVSAAGTCTGRGLEPTFQFPPEKLLTAVSVTNKSEFALVTLVDTKLHKGQVAILALESSGSRTHFVHEWPFDHPWSLPNVAVFTDIKLLGYLDLPDMEFPTSVCGVGNHEGGRMNGRDGNAGLLREYDLSKQADRDVFNKGNNAGFGSTAGFAVIASKYENKATFIDLQPLFAKVREMYFTTEENFQKTKDAGQGAKQWPYTFEADPSWKPQLVKTIDVPEPTAVLATLAGGPKARAFIASRDGTLGIYQVGGLETEAPADAGEISRISQISVGPNPTCLAYQKQNSNTIIAVSRGDRAINWIKYTDKTPTLIRHLTDARLKDPVNVEVADTHGIETSLISVTDFKGRQLINYRYSQLVWATQGGQKFGMGPEGKDKFECGGTIDFQGRPFCVSASNVN